MKLFLPFLVFIATYVAPPLSAKEPVAVESAPLPALAPSSFLQVQDEDTVVFLGDSITHQCIYTQYIETFFTPVTPSGEFTFTTQASRVTKLSTHLIDLKKISFWKTRTLSRSSLG